MSTTEIISPSPELKAAVAFHEAGHAVATVLAFQMARLPNRPPPRPIKHIGIHEEAPGKWGGICWGPTVYTSLYGCDERWRDAMEWQVVIDMAGGIAEAIHRGERNKRDMFWFALFNCGTNDDLESAEAILTDLRRLPPRRPHGLRRYAERACDLLRANWSAVKVIAAALIEHDRIDGARLNEIISNLPQNSIVASAA